MKFDSSAANSELLLRPYAPEVHLEPEIGTCAE